MAKRPDFDATIVASPRSRAGKAGADLDATLIAGKVGSALRKDEAPPEKIGKYVIRGELGRGAGGVVYRSYDPFVQRDVAVKVAKHHGQSATPETSEEGRAFFAEARAAGLLQHRHIVSLYDAGVEGSLFYLVMEYIDGKTLQPMCRPDGPRLPLDRVVDIIFKCAKALDYSHSRGILHRDIKPSNIMLTRNGEPKIMDFSIAEINSDAPQTFALTASLLGSPLYMSPEQARMEPLTPASDLYSLGAVTYQLLTGQPMFNAKDLPTLLRLIEREPAPLVDTIRTDVPSALCSLVARLLSKSPRMRYQTGNDLAGDLARIFDYLRTTERQVTRRDSSDVLRRVRFFDRFSDTEIDEILNASSLVTYHASAVISAEGQIENAFYIIVVGSAEIHKGGRMLHRLDKGDCFGEAGVLSAARSTYTLIARTQVLALKVSGTRLEQRSEGCQLRFYKTFLESLIYRLSLASSKANAAKPGAPGTPGSEAATPTPPT